MGEKTAQRQAEVKKHERERAREREIEGGKKKTLSQYNIHCSK